MPKPEVNLEHLSQEVVGYEASSETLPTPLGLGVRVRSPPALRYPPIAEESAATFSDPENA